jgi:hypothetical protein
MLVEIVHVDMPEVTQGELACLVRLRQPIDDAPLHLEANHEIVEVREVVAHRQVDEVLASLVLLVAPE